MPWRPPIYRRPGWQPPEVRNRAYDRARAAENRKIYDADWRRLRNAFVKVNPYCCVEGCGKPTHQVDHIISVRERPDLRLAWSNLRPLCASHHSSRTSRDHGWGRAMRDRTSDR